LYVLASIHWQSFDGALAIFRSAYVLAVLELLLLVTALGTIARSHFKAYQSV